MISSGEIVVIGGEIIIIGSMSVYNWAQGIAWFSLNWIESERCFR